MSPKKAGRLVPDGRCWCGCGKDAKIGSFFLAGHDRKAESAVIKMEYGGVAEFLVAHGYGSDGKNPAKELAAFMRKNP
jgi:hypothetical protein